jgi:hypothetical protein
MPHIAEHELLEYLDRELSGDRRAEVDRHVEDCPVCGTALDGLRTVSQGFAAALQRFDVTPDYGFAAVLARRKRRGQRHVALRALAKAAVLVFVVGGAGAAAIPGSPVRAWVEDAWSGTKSFLGLEAEIPSPGAVAIEPLERAPESAGIAVPLVDGRIRIDIQNAAADALVQVVVTAGMDAAVTAEGASYRTGSGWIEVLGAGAGIIRIELPQEAASAIVSVDGAPRVLKEGAKLRLLTPAADSSGSELQFRVER